MASALTGLRNVKEVQPRADDDCNMDLEGGTAMFDLLAHALANSRFPKLTGTCVTCIKCLNHSYELVCNVPCVEKRQYPANRTLRLPSREL